MHRRTVIAGAGAAGATGLAAFVYRAAPTLWNRIASDFKRDIRPAPAAPDPQQWTATGLHAAWLGHSTVLLRMEGCNILTDPVLASRIGLSLGPATIGLKRLVAPALDIEQLPHIDLVLLSHAHMDHFDIPTLRRLENKRTTVVTASRTADLLRPSRWRAVKELSWGHRAQVGPLEIRAYEVKHWGARMRTDSYRGYNAYSITAGRTQVLFGGDTAQTSLFHHARNGRPYDLAIMPVGAYNPWIHYHCTPEQAWQMAGHAGFEHFLGIHHQTFELSREPIHEPIERTLTVAGADADRVVARGIGQSFHLRV